MDPTTQSDDLIRFEGFALNPKTGELRKNGIRLNLQDQPCKVLVALLERPGEMVSREELRQRIWPEESFGDFDHAINRSIAKLRSVLGDSSEVPHLIETLPRRGYRFIGAVDGGEEARDAAREVGAAIGAIETVPAQPQASTLDPEVATTWRIGARWRTALTFGALIFVVLVALGIWMALPTPQPRILKSTRLTNDGKLKCCLRTDGARIYFSTADASSYFRIKQIPVTGGDPTEVPNSLDSTGTLYLRDISPEKDRLLIQRFQGTHISFWSVPLSGSSPRLLADATKVEPYANGSTWSPDGKMLAYTSGPNLVLAHSDGTEPRKLFSTNGFIYFPEWSPDSKWLRFLASDSLADGKSTLKEIPVTGGEPREVTPNWKEKYSEGFGRWSPDGRYFIFLASSGGRDDIWALRERPSFPFFRKPEPVRLTSGPVAYGSIAFSPDGKKVFTRGVEERGQVERYDPKISRFVPFSPALSADCCMYSNDGQWIAYVTFPEGDLWRSKTDGTERQQLTWPPLTALNPHWSPNGKEIAFTGFLPDKPPKTFLISAEGGEPHQLTQNECSECEANWSPDGTHLTFSSFLSRASPSCPLFVFTMDLKTHEVSRVPGSEDFLFPRWSPDGRFIVAQHKGMHALMLFDLGSQKWSTLLEVPSRAIVGFPVWSHDAKYISYRLATGGSDDGAYRIRISDRSIKKIAELSGITTIGLNTAYVGFDPDGNPTILRDASLNEIYALDVDLP